jgi:8-oxo-dGTP pyrophosphatase MutT (NUDIX family)
MSDETSAGAIISYLEDGKILYLLLHYVEGHFDFPKGHVEGNEKLEETALRETKEETGLSVTLKEGFMETFTYFYNNKQGVQKSKDVFFFLGESKSKDVVLSDEHIGFIWLSYENAVKKLTYRNAKYVLKAADEFLRKNENLI